MPPGHPEIASPIGNLAVVDLRTERLDDALAGFDEALALLERARALVEGDGVDETLRGKIDAWRAEHRDARGR